MSSFCFSCEFRDAMNSRHRSQIFHLHVRFLHGCSEREIEKWEVSYLWQGRLCAGPRGPQRQFRFEFSPLCPSSVSCQSCFQSRLKLPPPSRPMMEEQGRGCCPCRDKWVLQAEQNTVSSLLFTVKRLRVAALGLFPSSAGEKSVKGDVSQFLPSITDSKRASST